MKINPFDNGSDPQNSDIDAGRRRFLKGVGTAAAVGLAGCSETDPEPRTSEEPNTSNGTETEEPETEQEPEQEYLSGVELHDKWIHGETDAWEGKTVREFVATTDSIELDPLTSILEENDNRVNAVGQAVKNASEQFPNRGDYEMRHRHIMSAVDQAIEQTDWDFNFISNMNYTQTVGETIQYSEIKVPTGETTDSGHDKYAIINGALSPKMNENVNDGINQDHAVHIPGEKIENPSDRIYEQTMKAVRNSSLDGAFPPTDVEAIQSRVDRGADEDFFPQFATLMGYSLFAGGSDVEGGYGFRADEMLVPATKEIHEMIDEIGYEQGDRTDKNGDPLGTHGRVDLQLAINEEYFNEGYDEVDGPVVIDELEETSDGWNFELREEPDWNWEQGYPV